MAKMAAQEIKVGMINQGAYGSLAGARVREIGRTDAGEILVRYWGIADNWSEFEPTAVVDFRMPRRRR